MAAQLRDQIIRGRLLPGQRVVEGAWAREFGVAQASVREAINLLIADGFLVKDAGRSARVVRYSEQDVERNYEVRQALESQAARLATARQADTSPMSTALDRMAAALDAADFPLLVHSDLDFHLALGDASANPLLADMIRRLLVPLFAFVLLRVTEAGVSMDSWKADLPRHRRAIDLIADGDPEIAALYVQHCLQRFAGSAHVVWSPQTPARRARKSPK